MERRKEMVIWGYTLSGYDVLTSSWQTSPNDVERTESSGWNQRKKLSCGMRAISLYQVLSGAHGFGRLPDLASQRGSSCFLFYKANLAPPWRKQACCEVGEMMGGFPELRVHIVFWSGPMQRTSFLIFFLGLSTKRQRTNQPWRSLPRKVERTDQGRSSWKTRQTKKKEPGVGQWFVGTVCSSWLLGMGWCHLGTHMLKVNKASVLVTFFVAMRKHLTSSDLRGEVCSGLWLDPRG